MGLFWRMVTKLNKQMRLAMNAGLLRGRCQRVVVKVEPLWRAGRRLMVKTEYFWKLVAWLENRTKDHLQENRAEDKRAAGLEAENTVAGLEARQRGECLGRWWGKGNGRLMKHHHRKLLKVNRNRGSLQGQEIAAALALKTATALGPVTAGVLAGSVQYRILVTAAAPDQCCSIFLSGGLSIRWLQERIRQGTG